MECLFATKDRYLAPLLFRVIVYPYILNACFAVNRQMPEADIDLACLVLPLLLPAFHMGKLPTKEPPACLHLFLILLMRCLHNPPRYMHVGTMQRHGAVKRNLILTMLVLQEQDPPYCQQGKCV